METNETVVEQSEQEVQELTVEQIATEKGWKPKDQFEGDKDTWRNAKQFIEHGEILDSLSQLNRKNKKLTETLEKVVESTSKLKSEAFEKAKKELESELERATEQGDVKRVKDLAIRQVKLETEGTQPNVQFDTDIQNEIDVLKNNYPWIDRPTTAEEVAMRAFAIAREQELRKGGLSDLDTLKELNIEIKKRFVKTMTKSPIVSTVSTQSVTSPKKSSNVIPEEHQLIIKELKKVLKNFDEEQYLKDINLVNKLG